MVVYCSITYGQFLHGINHLRKIGRHVYPKQSINKAEQFDKNHKGQENIGTQGKKQSPIIVLGVAAAAALIGYTIIGTKTAIGAAIIAGGLMLKNGQR